MVEERLIKSNERVKNIGEVFTPKDTVDFMLNQPEVMAKINDLNATFLEPSAGEGAFLTEILRRKMQVALELSTSLAEYEDNSLIALSTLYGIELMEDNVEMLVMQMNTVFQQCYRVGVKSLNGVENQNVIRSAMVIIQANMAQGNALTKLDATGAPLVFSEWELLPKQKGSRQKVRRQEFTFEDIVNGNSDPNAIIKGAGMEVIEGPSLFDFLDSPYDPENPSLPEKLEEEVKISYAIVPIIEVYRKELVEEK